MGLGMGELDSALNALKRGKSFKGKREERRNNLLSGGFFLFLFFLLLFLFLSFLFKKKKNQNFRSKSGT